MRLLYTFFSFIFFTNSVYAQEMQKQPQKQEQPRPKEEPDPTAAVAGGLHIDGFTPPDFAVFQTGKTLPKGIFKLDSITAYSFGGLPGFDSTGARVNNGLSVSRWITGVQLSYGLTNKVSIGVGVPIVLSNQLSMNGADFSANSNLYRKYYQRFLNDAGTALSAGGGVACGGNSTPADCINYIQNGGSISNSLNIPIVLPTGETFILSPNTPIKNQIQAILLSGVTPANGATGTGDIQLGILWNVSSEDSPIRHVPLYFSIGGGLRMPTGKFNLPAAVRATGGDGTLTTGGGTFDVILRWNFDYVAAPGFVLSWMNQMENSVTGTEITRTSALDPQHKNTAWPENCNNLGSCGDGQSNDLYFTRKGIHYLGFLQAGWGVGDVNEKLKWLGLYTQLKYNIAAQSYLNGQPIYAMGDQFYLGDSSMHPDLGREQYYSHAIGFKLTGLPYTIPVELSTEFEYLFAGTNRPVNGMNILTTLSLFF